jgi:hypothetical protein
VTDDRRAVLEAIAYGDDPDLRPSDRLRALELLRDYRDDEDVASLLAREVAGLGEDVAQATLDAMVAAELAPGVDSQRWPEVAAVVDYEVRRRVRELADVGRIEAEIEQRAKERARRMYVTEGIRDVERSLTDASEPKADTKHGAPDPWFDNFKRLTDDS